MWGFPFEEHRFHEIPSFAKEDMWNGCGSRARLRLTRYFNPLKHNPDLGPDDVFHLRKLLKLITETTFALIFHFSAAPTTATGLKVYFFVLGLKAVAKAKTSP